MRHRAASMRQRTNSCRSCIALLAVGLAPGASPDRNCGSQCIGIAAVLCIDRLHALKLARAAGNHRQLGVETLQVELANNAVDAPA